MRKTGRHDSTLKEDITMNKHDTLHLPKHTYGGGGGLSLSETETTSAQTD